MAKRIAALAIDCIDAEALAAFWVDVLGWKITERDAAGNYCASASNRRSSVRRTYPPRVLDGPGYARCDGYPQGVIANEEVTDTVTTTKTYQVNGMTCDHCVNAVGAAVQAVAGVVDVEVDLPSGRLTVTGEGFADTEVGAAVDEAGYALAGAHP